MPVTATSSAALLLQGALDHVANSAAFIERCDCEDAAAAARRVHFTERSEDFEDQLVASLMPMAILSLDAHAWRRFAQGTQLNLRASGIVYLCLADRARYADLEGGDGPKESELDFLNFAFGVIDNLAENSGRDSGTVNFWPFDAIELLDYTRAEIDRRANEDFWTAAFLLRFDSAEGQG